MLIRIKMPKLWRKNDTSSKDSKPSNARYKWVPRKHRANSLCRLLRTSPLGKTGPQLKLKAGSEFISGQKGRYICCFLAAHGHIGPGSSLEHSNRLVDAIFSFRETDWSPMSSKGAAYFEELTREEDGRGGGNVSCKCPQTLT